MTALTFFFNPLGIGGEGCVVASVATEEATGWVAEGGMGGVSLLAYLDAIATAVGAFSNLFMDEALPQVLTIFASLREKNNKQSKNKYKEEEK